MKNISRNDWKIVNEVYRTLIKFIDINNLKDEDVFPVFFHFVKDNYYKEAYDLMVMHLQERTDKELDPII